MELEAETLLVEDDVDNDDDDNNDDGDDCSIGHWLEVWERQVRWSQRQRPC